MSTLGFLVGTVSLTQTRSASLIGFIAIMMAVFGILTFLGLSSPREPNWSSLIWNLNRFRWMSKRYDMWDEYLPLAETVYQLALLHEKKDLASHLRETIDEDREKTT